MENLLKPIKMKEVLLETDLTNHADDIIDRLKL